MKALQSENGGVPISGKSTKKLIWKVTFLFDMRNSEWNSILWIHAEYRDEGNLNAVDQGHTRL